MLHLFPYVQNYIKKTSHPNETKKYVQEQSMTKIFYNKFSSHHHPIGACLILVAFRFDIHGNTYFFTEHSYQTWQLEV